MEHTLYESKKKGVLYKVWTSKTKKLNFFPRIEKSSLCLKHSPDFDGYNRIVFIWLKSKIVFTKYSGHVYTL